MQLIRLLGVAAVASLTAAGQVPNGAPPGVVTLAVEGRASANPSVAAAGRFVAVAFSAATTNAMDIFIATSRDGGATFSAPVRVNAVDGEARVSGEEPPRVALVPAAGGTGRTGGTPDVVVVWTAKAGATWRLLSARSRDGGRTFGASAPVPGSDAGGSRGWQSVAVDPSGRVSVLWLDHRGLEQAPMQHGGAVPAAPNVAAPPAPKADPTERAALSQLYFATLGGAGRAVTRSVCYCCKTALVAAGNDVYAAWRHVYPGSVRDIAFAVSHDRGRTFSSPARVSEDRWQIDGCPDNGPSLAVDAARRVHAVWPTAGPGPGATGNAPSLALYYAVSRDGRTFSPRAALPTRGPASHAAVAIGGDGAPIVMWDETVAGARRLGAARVRTDGAGRVTFEAVPPPDAGAGQWYPALAASGRTTVAAWVRQAGPTTVVGVGAVR